MSYLTNIMVEAVTEAKKNNKIFYVYQKTPGRYYSSSEWSSEWLFKAYPGGRKVISISGSKLLDKQELAEIT